MQVWCVRWRRGILEGWCAKKQQNGRYTEYVTTLCGQYVLLGAIEKREPTGPECKAALRREGK
jgi:hypothetical protein